MCVGNTVFMERLFYLILMQTGILRQAKEREFESGYRFISSFAMIEAHRVCQSSKAISSSLKQDDLIYDADACLKTWIPTSGVSVLGMLSIYKIWIIIIIVFFWSKLLKFILKQVKIFLETTKSAVWF